MYKTHPSCSEPSSESPLWRYMDLSKYVSLLSRRQLFFCSAAKFEDPFEGELTRRTKDDLREWYMSDIPKSNRTKEHLDQAQKNLDNYVGFMKRLKQFTTLSCWHQNNDENFAMWKIYSNWNSGLAVVTNFERARAAFKNAKEAVYGGLVNYIAEEKDIVNPGNTFNHFMAKRRQFAFEREVRFIHEISEETVAANEPVDGSTGVYIDVDLVALIDKIYVAPQAGNWFRDSIGDLNKRYGIEAEIRQSSFFSSEHYS